MKSGFLFMGLLFTNLMLLHAQGVGVDEQAGNFLRESGKLYVVITVLVTIFAGIVIFLIFQERKISKLEKKLKDREPS
jgi:hypothetical protein